MAGTPVPLAAAPPGSNPHTPIAALSSTTPPSGPGSGGTKKSSNLRRGKWTVEEEAYVARVIQDFNSGFLNAPAGTTLRSYLSEKLQCDPMRITKKFTGESCIGKRVFHPAVRSASNAAAIDKAQVSRILEFIGKKSRGFMILCSTLSSLFDRSCVGRARSAGAEMEETIGNAAT